MRYDDVMDRVVAAAGRVDRDPADITVVAVSKAMSPARVLKVYDQGHRDFGENRASEMAEKSALLPGDIRWHFVGTLQSNKARIVRPRTALLHSMDRPALARAWLKGLGAPPPALLQVNIAGEESKAGVRPEEAARFLDELLMLRVDIRGLMAIPPPPRSPEDNRSHFRRLRRLADGLREQHPALTSLSMGMSDDFEVAIEEGASLIRVGRAIFGERD